MSDNFTGRWLVSEYVYNPDGTFAGIIHQHRHLEPQEDGRLRVIQQMETPGELDKHPMGRFAGRWTFDLVKQGMTRQYHGPDVVGSGTPYGESAMIGQGVWPRFGHNFISFALMPIPERQVTGGKFFNASQMIANIIGIAYPERVDETDNWPVFDQPERPQSVNDTWQGSSDLYAAAGKHKLDSTIRRRYKDTQITDDYANGQVIELDHAIRDGTYDLTGTLTLPGGAMQQPLYGKARRFGWLLESVVYTPQGTRIDTMEILYDRQLLMLRRWYQRGLLHHVEVVNTQPTEP
jgi:hypothetical protein